MTLDELTLETAINEAGQYEDVRISKEFAEHLLDLVKAQEPKAIAYSTNPYTGLPLAHCPKCLRPCRMFFPGAEEETHFCPRCGQAVKWE